jgi:ribose transport system substrate-binding protein
MRSMFRRPKFRHVLCCAAFLAACSALAACGSSGSSTSFVIKDVKKASEVSTTIPSSGCGAIATPLPNDPDGVIAALPQEDRKQYAGYTPTVHKSPWANFKPDHGPPYKIGLSFAQLTADSQVAAYNALKKTFGNDPDFKLTAVSTGSQFNIPQQIQQLNTLLNDKPDLLIVEPLTDAFGPTVDKAAKQGIPTLSVQGTTASKYAVNVQTNNYGSQAYSASTSFRQIGGKGNLLYVHGIASTTIDAERYQAAQDALKNCPNIKQVGEIAGAFLPATAKAETLKFLATHPEPVDVVLQTGGMAPGIISAFQQAGRPLPVVTDTGGMKASLGYWLNNKDSYTTVGEGYPPIAQANAIASISKRMLLGRGIQVSDVANLMPAITADNISQWAKPEWGLTTPGVAEGPPGQFLNEKFLSSLFKDPAPAN